jgi:hypothetical protein
MPGKYMLPWREKPGQFDIMVGSSSEDIRLKGSFKVIL